jgi:DNA-binding NarL/FixJ family response regulator
MMRIVLAEDHKTVREGIKMLVNAQSDMEVVGEAGDGAAAIKSVRDKRPDVIVMDISMPEMNGLKATRKLKAEFPDVKILTLTRHSDDSFLEQLIGAGASGYILKQSAPAELINAIRTVGGGNAYLDTSLTEKVMGGFLSRSLRGDRRSEVSDREMEVLRLIALGYSNKEIGTRLELSVKTVEAHKANAMRKLNMRGRIDIVRYAILQGWLEDS